MAEARRRVVLSHGVLDLQTVTLSNTVFCSSAFLMNRGQTHLTLTPTSTLDIESRSKSISSTLLERTTPALSARMVHTRLVPSFSTSRGRLDLTTMKHRSLQRALSLQCLWRTTRERMKTPPLTRWTSTNSLSSFPTFDFTLPSIQKFWFM